MTDHDPDAALLARYAGGDRSAARDLTHRLAPRAMSTAYRLLGDRAEAEDVTQEAMFRLWQVAPDWKTGNARVSTWLYRVVLNLCRDRHRRLRRSPVTLDDAADPADTAPGAVARLEEADRLAALNAALGTLPERQRQALVLRLIEELPNPQIAEIMGIGVEAVESLTARGKRALRDRLARKREELGYDS